MKNNNYRQNLVIGIVLLVSALLGSLLMVGLLVAETPPIDPDGFINNSIDSRLGLDTDVVLASNKRPENSESSIQSEFNEELPISSPVNQPKENQSDSSTNKPQNPPIYVSYPISPTPSPEPVSNPVDQPRYNESSHGNWKHNKSEDED